MKFVVLATAALATMVSADGHMDKDKDMDHDKDKEDMDKAESAV